MTTMTKTMQALSRGAVVTVAGFSLLTMSHEAFAIPTGSMGIRTYDVDLQQIAVDLRVEPVKGSPYLIEPIDFTSEVVGVFWLGLPAQSYAISALGNTGEPYPDSPLAVITVFDGANDMLVNLIAPPPCPTDVDDDRATGFSDLAALLANWGGCHLCASDVDDDNLVGFADLSAVLAGWGACPD